MWVKCIMIPYPPELVMPPIEASESETIQKSMSNYTNTHMYTHGTKY